VKMTTRDHNRERETWLIDHRAGPVAELRS
jgi:hypothetical protein